jgi:hypothetical protein
MGPVKTNVHKPLLPNISGINHKEMRQPARLRGVSIRQQLPRIIQNYLIVLRSISKSAKNFATQIVITAGANILKEFWPDIRKNILRMKE